MDWHIVYDKINTNLNMNNDTDPKKNNVMTVSAPQSGDNSNTEILNNLKTLNGNIQSMLSLMGTLVRNQTPTAAYTCDHGPSTTVTATRFDPRLALSIPRNVAAPPLPPLPNEAEIYLPTISHNHNKKEAE